LKIIRPSFEFIEEINPKALLKKVELAGRICYKSEDKISEGSSEEFVARIVKSGHESVLEHASISVKITCDRGVTHEIVRHRIASYSQESTRYCNYSLGKFGSELTFIKPLFWEEGSPEYKLWENAMQSIEDTYNEMIKLGSTAEKARSILPNSLKTEICVTMNLREWRHFFKLRTHPASHPQMVEIAKEIQTEFQKLLPEVF
jgi:thymidylate synthase (FAD)